MLLCLALSFESMRFIDNGQLKLGVDLDKGGAITFLAPSKGPNMVNDFDLGRQIQMSYYSGPTPFEPNGKKPNKFWAGLGWNPIQSGDVFENHSEILAFEQTKNSIYVKCIPMHWPLENVPGECTFESWIKLAEDTVELKQRMSNNRPDLTQYGGHPQELPAVYTNAPWHKLMTYTGDKPFTDDKLTEIPKHDWGKDGPWTSFYTSESWAALVDDNDFGLGVWAPDTYTISGGFFGTPRVGGSHDSPTGYLSPNRIEILDHNIVYDSRCTLIVGKLDRIRAYVKAHSGTPKPAKWTFKHDRLHWSYQNLSDKGWPIQGFLDLSLNRADPQLLSPAGFWPSSQAKHLKIDASAISGEPKLQVFWSRLDAKGFEEKRSLTFPYIADGKRRVYDFDLGKNSELSGVLTQIRIDPVPGGKAGDQMKIWSIQLTR